MQFHRDHHIWKVAAPDMSRPALAHISVERISGDKGIAIAANGFIMAIIPVVLRDDDIPGMVRADLFKVAAGMYDSDSRRRKKGDDWADMLLSADRVTLIDDSTHVRSRTEGPFPDWRRIMPKSSRVESVGEIGFRPDFVAIIGEALGIRKGNSGLRVTFNGLNAPMIVERLESRATDEPEAPYGIVMPMHITPRLREQKAGAA